MQLTVEIERKRKRKKRKENGELMVNAQRIKKKCRNAMIVRYRGFFFQNERRKENNRVHVYEQKKRIRKTHTEIKRDEKFFVFLFLLHRFEFVNTFFRIALSNHFQCFVFIST